MASQVGINNFDSNYWYMPNTFNTATRPQVQNTNLASLPQDTVEISGKKKSIAKKVLIGAGIAAAIGGIIFCAARGKFKQAKQLAEHIDFKPAETMEDAVRFARENLGVKLELGQDLHFANFINESLVKINNAMHGKSAMPKIIRYGECSEQAMMMADRTEITISKGFKNIAADLQNRNCTMEEYIRHLAGKDSSKDTANLLERILKGTIFHEMGHVNHATQCKNYGKMASLGKLKERGITDTHITEEFLSEVKDNKVLHEFFGGKDAYAFTSPVEYVAEVFGSRFVRDFERFPTIPEEVQRIYYKYGGPKIDF